MAVPINIVSLVIPTSYATIVTMPVISRDAITVAEQSFTASYIFHSYIVTYNTI